MGFKVEWCEERLRYKGLCNLHPLHVYYGETAEEAMTGIIELADGLDQDNDRTDVEEPMELADTQDRTNPWWPPFECLP